MKQMTQTKEMTTGTPWKLILVFALPLMVGNVFQQLYTVIDTMVVGRGIGVEALAALGAADWTSWMIVGLMSGATQGFSVVFSQLFGARDSGRLRRSVGTSVWLSVWMAVIVTAVSQLVLVPLLHALKTPEEIFPMALLYLRIVMGGAPIVMAYNLTSSILRSLGDSRTPLKSMIVACLVNVALDLLFVLVFHWGVAGAAIATLIAQLCAALFCFLQIRRLPILRLEKEDWKYDPALGGRMLYLGLPIAVNGIVIAVGGMIVQMVENTFGVLFIAGFTAVNKLYGILEIAATSFGYAIMTYTGQNLGAGKLKRIRVGVNQGIVLAICTSLVISGFMFLGGRYLLMLFISGTPEEVDAAMKIAWLYLRIMAAFLPVVYILYVYRSALQGLGNSIIPLVSGIVEFFMRVGSVLILSRYIDEYGIYIAEVMAWFGATTLLSISYFIKSRHLKAEEKKNGSGNEV